MNVMNNDLLIELEDNGAEVEDVLERLMGDEEMYVHYLSQFPDNKSIVELRQAVDAKDYKKAMGAVHTLKGMTMNLGLLPLTDVCMDMLLDFREGNDEAAAGQIDDVEEEFAKWSEMIQKHI